jgi:hypothetical protein
MSPDNVRRMDRCGSLRAAGTIGRGARVFTQDEVDRVRREREQRGRR